MATQVNLDALVPREDFEVVTAADETTVKNSMPISDLESDAFFTGRCASQTFNGKRRNGRPSAWCN